MNKWQDIIKKMRKEFLNGETYEEKVLIQIERTEKGNSIQFMEI